MITVALEASPSRSAAPSAGAIYSPISTCPVPAQAIPQRKRAIAPVRPAAIAQEQTLDDEALMVQIRNGVEAALTILYQRYYRCAHTIAYRILGDATEAEDIVQDAFLSLWRKAALYKEEHNNVCSWLQAIVRHRAIDRLRAVTAAPPLYSSSQSEYEQARPGEAADVWDEVWHNERSMLIRSVLKQLPAEQREAIELNYYGGYSHAEIAQCWNLPLGTVKGRLRLGLQKMKLLLRERGVETVC